MTKCKIRYPGKVQFQAYFEPDTHRLLKVLSAETGISMVKLVQRAVDGLLIPKEEETAGVTVETRREILE